MKLQSGQTILVTGSGGGIGLATAITASERGLNVVLADIVEDRLKTAVPQIKGPVHAIAMDISKREDWKRARTEAEGKFGAVDILVNCAAIPPKIVPLLDVDTDYFERIVDVNLKSVFYGMKTFGPPMRERKRGHISNVASQAGVLPVPQIGDYVATKYGVVGMSETARLELAPFGVEVSVCLPGLVRSNMTIGMGMDAIWVGRAIIKGIEANSPFIITHPKCREPIEKRHQTMLSCIGDWAQPGYNEDMWSGQRNKDS